MIIKKPTRATIEYLNDIKNRSNTHSISVEKIRTFIKKYYCLKEGETNNFLSEFDKEFDYDKDWY